MDNIQESNVTSEPSAEESGLLGVKYVAPAPLVEVLFEQLEFLATHLTNGEDCPDECPLCARLDEVSNCLLSPFRNPLNEI